MRIVLVNWSPLAEGAAKGGGVGGYCLALARTLAARGHEVFHLSCGVAYTPAPDSRADENSDRPGPCTTRRLADVAGVVSLEILNSPIIAPARVQGREPAAELAAPALDVELRRLFALLRADVVHFHNIEGFAATSPAAVRAASPRAALLYSLHNYHPVCPQVNLMFRDATPCHDFDAGHLCAVCFPAPDPAAERRHRASLHRPSGPRDDPSPRASGRSWARLLVRGRPVRLPPSPEAYASVRTDADLAPRAPSSISTSVAPARGIDPPEWLPLDNVVVPEPPNDRPPNPFGRRRAAMVDMLSAFDRVLAVSEFVHRKFEAFGVDPRVIRTLPIGCALTDAMTLGPPPPPPRAAPPIRMVFMGFNLPHKGLSMLLDSLELVPADAASRLWLEVNARDAHTLAPRFAAVEPRLAGLTVRDGYDHAHLPALLAGRHLGLVPSTWWDNGPQTVMEFFACGLPVLGAQLGGIPDLVRHGVNGLLHRGNDRRDLALNLARVALEPDLLPALRAGVTPPISMADHVVELEDVYADVIAARAGPQRMVG